MVSFTILQACGGNSTSLRREFYKPAAEFYWAIAPVLGIAPAPLIRYKLDAAISPALRVALKPVWGFHCSAPSRPVQ